MLIFLTIIIITIILIGLCFLGLGIKIFLKKNGKFSHTCAFDFDKNKCKDCKADCKDCQKNIKIDKIKINN